MKIFKKKVDHDYLMEQVTDIYTTMNTHWDNATKRTLRLETRLEQSNKLLAKIVGVEQCPSCSGTGVYGACERQRVCDRCHGAGFLKIKKEK